jgi:hypothetical protein
VIFVLRAEQIAAFRPYLYGEKIRAALFPPASHLRKEVRVVVDEFFRRHPTVTFGD